MAEDVATRFEVPMACNGGSGLTLPELFNILEVYGRDFTEYTVERASLESVFMKVIRENNIKEEGHNDDISLKPARRFWKLF